MSDTNDVIINEMGQSGDIKRIAGVTVSWREVDRTTLQLLPPNKPNGYLPALTLGDGHCMPRSFSKIVFGHENSHLEMRSRIIAEPCLNKDLYLDENFMSIGHMQKKDKILSHCSSVRLP